MPETAEQINARVTMMADTVRAGLSAAASDIMESLMAAGTPDAAAVMMIGARMFVADTHESIADQIGADKSRMRHQLVETIGAYFDEYAKRSVLDRTQG